MMRKVIIIFSLILSFKAFPQADINFAVVEKTTFDYYMNGGWLALIDVGNKAIQKDIDYYYLNYRMGVAYFQLNKYMLSAYHLEKALAQNSGALADSLLISTLFLDYVYSGRLAKAEQIKKYHFDKAISDLPLTKKVSSAYIEGGTTFLEDIKTKAFKERKYYYYKGIDLFQKMSYYNADIQGYISTTLKYQAAFTGMQVNRFKFYKEIPDTFQQNFTLFQNYAFLGLKYYFGLFSISPAVNLVGFKSNELSKVGIDTLTNRNIYDTLSQKTNSIVASIKGGISYKNIEASLSLSYSNLLQSNQYQLTTDLIYFPDGNYDSYLSTQIVGKWENGISYGIFKEKLGLKLTDFLWMELSYTAGNLKNYNADNGYYVYNTRDQLKSITSINFIALLSKHLEINMVFQNLLKENFMESYPNTFNTTIEKTNYNFQQLNIIGGIKWTF